ncbi:hypothetical protein F3Y22_tig00110764pilonHSYRG00034 [Hibiscus syriacus]|uniref:RRM domain-containing protein n=1 Tax=Hibiscus syriacus TaxID=106335 RepID=A0A6A2ZVI0_HIBSY|nr:hypothetical protein F3Y22_tig00110764pilonHSYRG00034 [Hibiscus syriacus]
MGPPVNLHKLGNQSDESVPPSNHLWVGNMSVEAVDSDLTELFNKFGALDSVTTYSARGYAFVYFKRVEDAMVAREALQGATLHGNHLKIDFARPAKPCKNLWIGGISQTVSKEDWKKSFRSSAMKHEREATRMGSSDSQSVAKRTVADKLMISLASFVGCFPPSVQIDEQMLHNALILFGEIENVKSFPSRNYAFVESGVWRKLGIKWPRPGMMLGDHPFRPSQMDILGQNHPIATKYSIWIIVIQWYSWIKCADQAIASSSSAQGFRSSPRQASGSWDVYDVNQLQRDAKRSRIETAMPIDDLGVTTSGPGPSPPDNDFIWRALLPRVNACLSCSMYYHWKGAETELPEVVNCSARTGLDMLAKHYREAVGFDVVSSYRTNRHMEGFCMRTPNLPQYHPDNLPCKVNNPILQQHCPKLVFLLTPDLIATLASFLPTTRSLLLSEDQQLLSLQPHLSNSLILQHITTTQHYSTISSTPAHSAQMAHGGTQFQESVMPQQGAASSMPLTNFNIPSQVNMVHFYPINQHFQPQQLSNPIVLSNQAHGATVSQAQNLMQADRKNRTFLFKYSHSNPFLSGAGQGTSDVEVDNRSDISQRCNLQLAYCSRSSRSSSSSKQILQWTRDGELAREISFI